MSAIDTGSRTGGAVGSAGPDPKGQRQRRFFRSFGIELFTIPMMLVVIMGIWYLAIYVFDIAAYVLPPPDAVVTSIWSLGTSSDFWSHFVVTAREASIGFALGTVIACVLGTSVSTVEVVRKTLLPYVIGWQSFPHLPLAPLLVVWFGFGETSKVVMAAIVSFFPMFVAIVDGLGSSKQAQLDMLRVFGASPVDVFLKVRMRNAFPYFFTGVNVSVIYAILGAVVAEWIGASAGMGHLLLAYNYNFQIGAMFGVLFYLSALGILVHTVVRFVRARVVFWEI